MVELAAAGGGPVKAERISQAQEIPAKFLENIMADLRNAGLVRSQRGIDGGYWLARPAERDRPRPGDPRRRRPARERPRPPAGGGHATTGPRHPLRDVWVAVRASLRGVLESVTLADVASGELPRRRRAR